MGYPEHRCSTLFQCLTTLTQASCGEKSTRWMLNRTFLLSGMKGCYLSRAKRELRCRGRGRKSSKLARHALSYRTVPNDSFMEGEVGEYQTAHYRDMHAAFPK
ncbi:uncharacterized protein ACIQIH_005259 isoform 1-T1 [Cyanocitta cristata]